MTLAKQVLKRIEEARKVNEVYFHDKDGQGLHDYKKNSYISDNSLSREYKLIARYENLDLYLHSNPQTEGLVGIFQFEDDGEIKNLLAFHLFFHEKDELCIPMPKVLQVDLVTIHDIVRNTGIASRAYIELVKLGFTIASDFSQYRGGRALWEKIAKNASKYKMKVTIWDKNQKEFIQDLEGKVIVYNGDSINSDEIWTNDNNNPITDRVLVLSNI